MSPLQAVVLAAAGVLAASCSSGATSDPVGDDGGAGSSLDCAALIPEPAWTALGWEATRPEPHAGRCRVRAEGQGEITVGTRAAPGGDDAEAAADEVRGRCDQLRSDAPHFIGRPPWLSGDSASCYSQVAPGAGTGVAEVVFADRRDRVVQIRIAAYAAADESAVEQALRTLTAAASDL